MRFKFLCRYWWRKLCHLLGYCPRCGAGVMKTRSGNSVCPNCGQR